LRPSEVTPGEIQAEIELTREQDPTAHEIKAWLELFANSSSVLFASVGKEQMTY